MSSRKTTAQQKNSHNKIEGLTYEPWGMPTERVLRLNAEYAKKEAENSSRKEIIRHLITPDIQLFLSDGTLGLELFAPFDRIIVAAGGPTIPDALKNQLAKNGIMLIPVGCERMSQNLIRVFKSGNVCKEENHGTTTFVDLVGKQGW